MTWTIFISFLKVGIFGFGSGPAMLALMEKEMLTRGLMSGDDFHTAVDMSMTLPGPLATKVAVYCGYKVAGIGGAAAAITGALLPSSIAILILARLFMQWRGHPRLDGMLRAMRPVVVAVFLYLAWSHARGISDLHWATVLLGLAAFALLLLRIDPVWVILGAVILGLLFF